MAVQPLELGQALSREGENDSKPGLVQRED